MLFFKLKNLFKGEEIFILALKPLSILEFKYQRFKNWIIIYIIPFKINIEICDGV
jgi:hypothetical protein